MALVVVFIFIILRVQRPERRRVTETKTDYQPRWAPRLAIVTRGSGWSGHVGICIELKTKVYTKVRNHGEGT